MSHADPSLSPLMALLGQAERERDDAVAQAQRAEAQLAAAQGQGEQLLAYRQDYEARFRDRFSRQGSIDTFQTYQGFMGRLSLAVDQQQGVVAQAARRADAARQVVREHELRVASVRKLIERRLTELRMAADRRDQKQTDEFASRAAWNRLAAEQAAPTV